MKLGFMVPVGISGKRPVELGTSLINALLWSSVESEKKGTKQPKKFIRCRIYNRQVRCTEIQAGESANSSPAAALGTAEQTLKRSASRCWR